MSALIAPPQPETAVAEVPPRLAEHGDGEMEMRPHRWTRAEYHKMAEAGIFDELRVELLNGEVLEMPAQLTPHAVSVGMVTRTLYRTFGSAYFPRVQAPIALNDGSEPEPDLAVVPGLPEDYIRDHPHPDQILLLVEISDSTLRKDRTKKSADYAQAGIADYWIVNLVNRQLEVYRDPSPEGAYQSILILGPAKSIAPLHAPDAPILVADLLPPLPTP